MAHKWDDGTEEHRPRTPEEMAAIEEENRIAARSNLRTETRRRGREVFKTVNDEKYYSTNGLIFAPCQRSAIDRRSILSTFERDMLMEENDGEAA